MSHGRGLTNATPPAVAAHVLIGIATAPRSRTYSSYKTTSGTRTSRTRRATRAPRRDGSRGCGTQEPIEGRLRREQGIGPQLGCRIRCTKPAAPEAMSQAQLDFWSEQGGLLTLEDKRVHNACSARLSS